MSQILLGPQQTPNPSCCVILRAARWERRGCRDVHSRAALCAPVDARLPADLTLFLHSSAPGGQRASRFDEGVRAEQMRDCATSGLLQASSIWKPAWGVPKTPNFRLLSIANWCRVTQFTSTSSRSARKLNEMPCHHSLEEYLDAYIQAAGIARDRKGPLFRAASRKTKGTHGRPHVAGGCLAHGPPSCFGRRH